MCAAAAAHVEKNLQQMRIHIHLFNGVSFCDQYMNGSGTICVCEAVFRAASLFFVCFGFLMNFYFIFLTFFFSCIKNKVQLPNTYDDEDQYTISKCLSYFMPKKIKNIK